MSATEDASAAVKEADRIMQICNACRYCEGYCAVFPAMARRLTFNEADLNYLANLCHNCGACYYACQYAPPHEFAVNVPQTFAEVRVETYRRYAWPQVLGVMFKRNGLATSFVTAATLSAFLFGLMALQRPEIVNAVHTGPGAFYRVIPHETMVTIFGAVALYVVLAFVMGFRAFWLETGEKMQDFATPTPLWRAVSDVLTLKYLDGGGEGCTYPDDKPSFSRRAFHHCTFYGFLLCFAATSTGTIFHYAGIPAPYGVTQLPKLLGIAGGIGLLIGPAGLLWLKWSADPALGDSNQRGMDQGFLALLFLTSLSGFVLFLLRSTPIMGVLLAVHLGIVLGLFLTLPYGKFVHAIYRFAALVRYQLERMRPNPNPSFE
jgi:citrate/tricarballylate utilization protein